MLSRVHTNAAWSLMGLVVPALLAFACIPFLLHSLGPTRFGWLSLLWVLSAYINFFDLGISRQVTIDASRLRGDPAASRRIFVSALRVSLGTGLAGAALGALVTFAAWRLFPSTVPEELFWALLFAVLSLVPNNLWNVVRGRFEGQDQFARSSLLRAVQSSLAFCVPWCASLAGVQSLATMSFLILLARLSFVAVLAVALWRRQFFARELTSDWGTQFLKHQGGWVTLSNLVGPLMVNGDRFLLMGTAHEWALSTYALAQEFSQRILVLPTAFCSALLPHASAQTEPDKAFFVRNMLTMFAVTAVVAVGVFLVAPFAIPKWLARESPSALVPAINVLILGCVANAVAMVPYTALLAKGKIRTLSLIHLVELIIFVPCVFILVKSFGVMGIAYAWSGRAAIDLAVMWIYADAAFLRGRRD